MVAFTSEQGTDTCQFVWTISMLEKFGFLLNDCFSFAICFRGVWLRDWRSNTVH
jgi:hypothetical protein